ncbi:hypothetical protein JOM56_009017 [Amanita muscaria]|uniref:Protein kinase domain-containing protein n=1 Tax=Amanita muscaria (strain Koide BX008) TaxID=946122 RepID=A0A0C2X876_AMAMK|nr:hypothetical protein M378DRAFT_627339 [Amanita muscaria Koide BX008]
MLEVAKAIQHLHSIGAVFHCQIELDDVFLDSKLHAKIRYLCSTLRHLTETPLRYLLYESDKTWHSCEVNVFIFGCFFYEVRLLTLHFPFVLNICRCISTRLSMSDTTVETRKFQTVHLNQQFARMRGSSFSGVVQTIGRRGQVWIKSYRRWSFGTYLELSQCLNFLK